MATVDIDDLEKLKIQQAEAAGAEDEDDTEDIEETFKSLLLESINELRTSAVAFDFLSNPDLVQRLSKRERGLMERRSNAIYDLADKVQAAIEASEDF